MKIPIIESILEFTSGMVNFIYTMALAALNIIFGLNLPALAKAPSLASVAILGFIGLTIFEVFKFLTDKKQDIPILLILIALMFYPLSIAGMIKSKYTIYFTFAFILMLGYFMGRMYHILTERLKKWDGTKNISMIKQIVFAFLFVSFIYPIVLSSASLNLSYYSLVPLKFADNPMSHLNESKSLCAFFGSDPNNKACQFSSDPEGFLNKTENQFSPDLCYYTFLYSNIMNKTTNNEMNYVASLRCQMINSYWISSMEWMKTNLPADARITSWWDYGHWSNFFAKKASVIRNEHVSMLMIGNVANLMIMDNLSDTKNVMKEYGSKYLMIDSEIILNSDAVFGSKFYALNYLACARDNLTNVNIPQMNSRCEYDNLWEDIAISNKKCLISSISNKWGLIAVKRSLINNSEGVVTQTGAKDAYCVANTTLSDGSVIPATYYLDRKTLSGELMLNKGFMVPTKANTYVMLYTQDTVWVVDGQIMSGYGDRIGKGRFYDSTMYKGFVLNQLEGFRKIYDNGNVKIYEMVE